MAAPKGNLYGLGNHAAGRPPKYGKPEELEAKILDYFTWILGEYEEREEQVQKKRKNPDTGKMELTTEKVIKRECVRPEQRPTWTGLALFLGFESRKSLHDYTKKEAFSYPIKRALLIIESSYEELLTTSSVAGVIFALKNLGWKDTQDINHSGKIETGEDLSALSDEELRARIAKLKQANQTH